jgi:hypothetical protein
VYAIGKLIGRTNIWMRTGGTFANLQVVNHLIKQGVGFSSFPRPMIDLERKFSISINRIINAGVNSVPGLAMGLTKGEPHLRKVTLQVLQIMDQENDGLDLFIYALENKHSYIRFEAVKGISSFLGSKSLDSATKQSLVVIISKISTNDKDFRVRAEAIKLLEAIKDGLGLNMDLSSSPAVNAENLQKLVNFLAQKDIENLDKEVLKAKYGIATADLLLILGNSRVEVPEAGARAYKDGLISNISVSGGIGRETHYLWDNVEETSYRIHNLREKSEAQIFKEILIENGVNEKIFYSRINLQIAKKT